MVKLAVYTVESSKNEKDLKKEKKEPKKDPISLLEPPLKPSIKVVPIDDGGAYDKAGTENRFCTRRVLLIFLCLSLLVLLTGVVGFIGYEKFLQSEKAVTAKKTDFKTTVDIDVVDPDKQVGGDGTTVTKRATSKTTSTTPSSRGATTGSQRFQSPKQESPESGEESKPTTPLVVQSTTPYLTHIHEDIDISFENNTEYFNIPESEFCERILIVYDFDYVKAAYRLIDTGMCFVKDLDLGVMSLMEFYYWLSDPANLRNHFEMIKDEYVAVEPELDDLTPFGPTISYYCGGVPTFWLIPVPDEEEAQVTAASSSEEDDGYPPPDHHHHHGRKRREGEKQAKTVKIQYLDGDSREITINYYKSV